VRISSSVTAFHSRAISQAKGERDDAWTIPAAGITGTIYGAKHHGVEMIAIIQAGDHMPRATIPANSNVAVNQTVQFSFTQDKLHFDPLTGNSPAGIRP
jgi:hypothetical protein